GVLSTECEAHAATPAATMMSVDRTGPPRLLAGNSDRQPDTQNALLSNTLSRRRARLNPLPLPLSDPSGEARSSCRDRHRGPWLPPDRPILFPSCTMSSFQYASLSWPRIDRSRPAPSRRRSCSRLLLRAGY